MAQKMKKDLFTLLIPLMTLVFGASIAACSSTPPAPSLEITVDEIADLYAQNPASVQSKCVGKWVAVTGVLAEVKTFTKGGWLYIGCIDQREGAGRVLFKFDSIDSAVEALKIGEKVTLIGYGEADPLRSYAFDLEFTSCAVRE